MRRGIWILTPVILGLVVCLPAAGWSQEPTQQEDLKKQIGTIIVTPGNGPNLAVADFIARSAGLEAAAGTFNQVLWADLDFAAVSGLVGKKPLPEDACSRSRFFEVR